MFAPLQPLSTPLRCCHVQIVLRLHCGAASCCLVCIISNTTNAVSRSIHEEHEAMATSPEVRVSRKTAVLIKGECKVLIASGTGRSNLSISYEQ